MPFNENWRSRRKSPDAQAPDPAAAALGRAIMLARALKWREEWQAEMAARRAKANGGAGKCLSPRSAKQNGDAQFAAAVTRNEFGRFYWDAAQAEAPPKKSRATSKRNGENK
jgi:hypothetical protein